ncbi:MAG: LD-carboxypeptidase [Acetobacteraceae bacterium]|nr:LD-carboxypeptidase [Acetobacteraceae bacterium]
MAERLQRPPRLKKGDTIGIVAPSTFAFDDAAYRRGVELLERKAFRVKEGFSVGLRRHYAAGRDADRARDLEDMFLDPEVHGIVCLIGGSVAARLLDRLDYAAIARHPKVFTGLSDITHLHLAFVARAAMVSLHHIDLMFGFGGDPANPATAYSLELFERVTTQAQAPEELPAFSRWESWRPGSAQGRLIGGWLPALVDLAGTPYWPDLDDVILFWEAIDLPLREIDRLLTALRLSGVFGRVRGMLVGKTPGCSEPDHPGLRLSDLVAEVTEPYGFPILGEVDFGHVDPNLPLPEGVLARFSTSPPRLELLEPMVT